LFTLFFSVDHSLLALVSRFSRFFPLVSPLTISPSTYCFLSGSNFFLPMAFLRPLLTPPHSPSHPFFITFRRSAEFAFSSLQVGASLQTFPPFPFIGLCLPVFSCLSWSRPVSPPFFPFCRPESPFSPASAQCCLFLSSFSPRPYDPLLLFFSLSPDSFLRSNFFRPTRSPPFDPSDVR